MPFENIETVTTHCNNFCCTALVKIEDVRTSNLKWQLHNY